MIGNRAVYSFLVVCILSSCATSFKIGERVDDYIIHSDYVLIKDRLYRDVYGDFYFRSAAVRVSSSGVISQVDAYIKRFSFFKEGEKSKDLKLSDVIDEESWFFLLGGFYFDKENGYCFSPDSDGGYLYYLGELSSGALEVYSDGGWRGEGDLSSLNSGRLNKYFRVGDRVFYDCTELYQVDSGSFVVLDEAKGLAKDGARKYVKGYVESGDN